jgi:hypothetical protein
LRKQLLALEGEAAPLPHGHQALAALVAQGPQADLASLSATASMQATPTDATTQAAKRPACLGLPCAARRRHSQVPVVRVRV